MTALAAGALVVAGASVAAVLTALVVRRRWLLVRVRGTSMLPALRDGDLLLARRCTAGRLATGDIVVSRWPDTGTLTGHDADGRPVPDASLPTGLLVKRVAARPGEPVPGSVRPVVGDVTTVPDRALVLLGDNDAGMDSRAFGLLPADRVVGVVVRHL